MRFLKQFQNIALKYPFAFWFCFPSIILSLAVIGLDPIKIDCRFLYMVSDISEHGFHVTATINGSTYPDYLSPFFILSWLTSCGGHFLNRFTLVLPSILCGALSIAITCKIGEHIRPYLGHLAALLALSTYHFIDTFLGFGLDSFVCLCGICVLYTFMLHKGRPLLQHLIFAGALIASFAVRGFMGPVLIGVGSAAFLLTQKNWKGILTFGLTGAISLALCGFGFWFALNKEGGRELWDLCIEWQFGNRFTYQAGDPLFYLVYSYLMYAPAGLLFLFTILFAKKKLLQQPLSGLISYVLAIEILLTFPNCQHLRYMTLALPAMALAGAWGVLNIPIQCDKIRHFLSVLTNFLIRLIAFLILPSFLVCAIVCAILKINVSYWNIGVGFILEALLLYVQKPVSAEIPQKIVFLLLSATFLICFQILPILEGAEKTMPSVRNAEQICNGAPVYFYFIDADHDGIKYLSAIDRKRVKDIVFISSPEEFYPDEIPGPENGHTVYNRFAKLLKIRPMTIEDMIAYPWNLYNYATEEEVLPGYKGGIFILRDKQAEEEKFLDAMRKYGISVKKSGSLRLGHRQYLLYR